FVDDSLAALRDTLAGPSNYIFVGEYAYYNETSVTDLLDYVERGNNAFIAAYDLPEELGTSLFSYDCYYSFYDTDERMLSESMDTVMMQLLWDSTEFEVYNVYDFEPFNRLTSYFNGGLFCDDLLDNEIIGTFSEVNINFARLNWGQGNFYVHTNPLFFTNYYLVDSLQYQYAEAILAVLGPGPVYWDESCRVPPSAARKRSNQSARNSGRGYNGGRNLLTGNEALSYIQEQAPLALAWYTLLVATFLYIIFRGKRRQRIIPIIHRRENSSKRFIDTISRLVYQKGHHLALAKQELASLRHFLLERFGLKWREGEPPPENLAEVTGIADAAAERALIEIRIIQNRKYLEDHELIRFYRAIEPIYKL
ncbi:MAG: hypothetical protein AAF840_08730, partial [Bacteroidota bacterium]